MATRAAPDPMFPARKFQIAAPCALIVGILAGAAMPAGASTFIWQDAAGVWSAGANWTGGAPASSALNDLVFGGTGASSYTSTNDLAGTFQLHSIALNSSASVPETIAGNALQFVSNGATNPQIAQNGSGAFTIATNFSAANALTFGGSGAGLVTLAGVISGGGGLTFSSGNWRLTSAANAFTGGVRIQTGAFVELTATGAAPQGVSLLPASTSILGANTANALTIDGGTLKVTTKGSGGITLGQSGAALQTVNFGANGGVFDLANINEVNPAVQGGNILGGGPSINTTAGTATAVIRWNGGQLGLSSNNANDANLLQLQNALRFGPVTGTGALRIEITNGAMLRADIGTNTVVPMALTIRGVAGGDPTSGPLGALNPALTRDVGRYFLATGSMAYSQGVTFEDAVQVIIGNASRSMDGPVTIAGSAGGHAGFVTFAGRPTGTAFGPGVHPPTGSGAGSQSMLWLGRDNNDTLTIQPGGTGVIESRGTFYFGFHNGVLLNASTLIQPGGTLRFFQSISNFSPTGSTTGIIANNTLVANHIVQGDLTGQGSTAADSVIDLYLPAANAIPFPIPAIIGPNTLPFGGVSFEASSSLVVNGTGFGGLRVNGLSRPNLLFQNAAPDPVSNARKLDNLLSPARLAGLSGSGGYLTAAAAEAMWLFPADGEWNAGISVGLKVANSASAGDDVSFALLNMFRHHVAIEAGASLAAGPLPAGYGPLARTPGLGTLQGEGAVNTLSVFTANAGATIAPGMGGIGTLTLANLALNGSLETEIGTTADLLSVSGNLTLGATSTLRLSTENAYANADHIIASYGGALAGAFAAVENLPVEYKLAYGSGSGDAIRLLYAPAASRVWTGALTGDWDAATANWQGAALYADDQNVRFDDTATGTHSITIAGGDVTPRSVTFDTATGYDLSGTPGQSIAGLTRLVKNGAGSLIIAGAHTYGGGTAINAGSLVLFENNVLPDVGTVTVAAGATLNLAGYTDTVGDLTVDGSVTAGLLRVGLLTLNGAASVAANLQIRGGVAKTGAAPATLSGSIAQLGEALVFDVAAGTSPELTVSGWISESTVAKNGAGTLLLTGTNDIAFLQIAAGTVRKGAPDAIPTGTAATVGSGATLDLAGYAQTFNSLSGAGAIALGGSALTINQSGSTVFRGPIAGAGSVTKSGGGMLELLGANTFNGGLTINGGIVRLGAAAAAGTGTATVNAAGVLVLGNAHDKPIVLNGGTLSAQLGVGTGLLLSTNNLHVTASSSLTLYDLLNPAANSEMILTGVLHSATPATLAVTAGANNPTPNTGAALRLRNTTTASTFAGTIALGQSAKLEVRGAGANFSAAGTGRIVLTAGSIGSFTAAATTGTYSEFSARSDAATNFGNAIEISGTGAVSLNVGNVTVAGVNNTVTFGNLRIGDAQKLTVNRGTAGYTAAFSSVTLTGGMATFSPADAAFSAAGNALRLGLITEAVAGSGFTMSGTSTLTLTAAASHTGPTVVAGGTLIVSGAISASSQVSVNNGTLAGTGPISSPVAIGDGSGSAASAIVSPGAVGAIGTLPTGALSLANSDAAFKLELNSAALLTDLLNVTGPLTLGSGLASLQALDLAAAALPSGTFFTIARSTGGVSGTFAGLPEGASLSAGVNLFAIGYLANGGMDIRLTVIPEPGAAALVCAGLGLLAGLSRNRRKNSRRCG